MPDKHEVDGSIPFEPTTIWNYKQAVQGKWLKNCEIVRLYIEQFWKKFDKVMRRLELQRKHIEKYIDEKGKLEKLVAL